MTTDPKRRESTLARIRALMAKTTENGCTEAEAAEAARKVDELMALYEIDLDELAVRKQEIVQVAVAKTARHEVAYAAKAIAVFTDCMVWMTPRGVTYLGFMVDTQVAEYLTLLFQRAIDREHATHILFNQEYERGDAKLRRELRESFGVGMASRLGERLRELKSKRDFTAKTSGRDLVAMKGPVVAEAFRGLGIELNRRQGGFTVRNQGAYHAGAAAAARVAINQGVADRAARQAGRIA